MKLLPLAQQLAEAIDTTIAFDEGRCLRTLDRFSECRDCFTICPAGAIEAGNPPTLDIDACFFCRACLPVCPIGAYTYTGIDAAKALVDCAGRMQARRFELFCQLNPNFDHGPLDIEAAIRVRGCLAGLGTGVYLALASQGPEKVLVRADACAGCTWQGLQPVIENQLHQAQTLLKQWGLDHVLAILSQVSVAERTPPSIWKAESPPLSRHSLLHLTTRESDEAEEQDAATGRFRERVRVLRAVNQLSTLGGDAEAGVSPPKLGGLGFATLAVSEACTACATCARVCPTEALVFSEKESEFQLTFTPRLCIGCDFCAHVCAPQAITFDHQPDFTAVFGGDIDLTVQQGDLAHCAKCKAPFAARTGSKLCPPCDFRRKNPFGYRPPAPANVKRAQ
jgi:ferredoxin